MDYKKTLNLPETEFPIRTNLQKVEEELLTFWKDMGLYEEIQRKNKNLPKYILHDGPPYANGDVHLGTALNKILKDIVVKYKVMSGFNSPFVPGWDCHGLPIETALLKELGGGRISIPILAFREKCKEYAHRYIDIQRKQFMRLGVFGDWFKPYLTLNPSYEEKIIELFGKLAEGGYIYRGLKPIHWCPNCETALAEAEIEYEDEESLSIYVKFPVFKTEGLSSELKILSSTLECGYFIIWTTTPWTLPANVAIALHPEHEYAITKVGEETYVVALPLLENIAKKLGWKNYKVLDKAKGTFFEGIVCRHPFVNRDVMVVLDNLVNLEEGTGCVHIAPGHGEEDYQIGLNYKLPMIMPVDKAGCFTDEAGKYAGMHVEAANETIISDMRNSNVLLHSEKVIHSYPHCWRCKKPVIFRATEQWFISVDKNDLRREALAAIGNTKWFPPWGETRIRGMIESRPDWCISRQRSWGVPIPVFYCESCKKPLMTGSFNKAIREAVLKEGSDVWFKKEASQILPSQTKCPHCSGTRFKKETDILDVWFESGASHFAVLKDNPILRWPADLYLEGSDQHRGWFQTSLLTSVPTFARAPYESVLTHGFTVDEQGRKMSKSLGNVVDPQDVVKKYSADILRLWVASTDFRGDMGAGEGILKHVQEAFIKIRNTCRFLLSNLGDFSEKDIVPYNNLLEVDKWALLRLNQLIERCLRAYDDFEFHIVYHSIYDFCVNDLSALYLDISKDRLYCDGERSIERKSAQSVLYEILITLIRLFAPILSFTAEDILRYIESSKLPPSIFLMDMPKVNNKYLDKTLEERWKAILEVREEVYRALEDARGEGIIGSSLEAQVLLYADGETKRLIESQIDDLPMVFITSQVELGAEGTPPSEAVSYQRVPDLKIVAKKAKGKKCERCWKYSEDVGRSPQHKTLCGRCVNVVEEILKEGKL